MEVNDARKIKLELENSIAELIYQFEHSTGTFVKNIEIYRSPSYIGYSDNLGAVTVLADVRI